ncbi:MAG: hypothetical protein ACLQF4_16690, partial [Xanthobacteraceae bacterium]
LINGGQFVPQRLVEVIEDTGLASHHFAPDCALVQLLGSNSIARNVTDHPIIAAVTGLESPLNA